MALHKRCPDEISVQILSGLSTQDLTSTSRTSRHLHEISQPLLYKKPYLTTALQPPPSLYIFLRTLLTPGREILATYVKMLSIEWTGEYNLTSQPASDTAPLNTAASALGLNDPFASEGSQALLLMHLLPRLNTLHIIPPHTPDHFEEFILALEPRTSSLTLPMAFQSLAEVRWYSGDSLGGINPSVLLSLLQLPRIRKIELCIVSTIDGPFPGSDGAAAVAGTSAVTELDFVCRDISGWLLTRILLIPRALTHFTYRAVSGNHLDLSMLRAALTPLRNTLQSLDLDLFRCISCDHHGEWQKETIGSLREWPVLRHVGCSLMALLGMDVSRLAEVLPCSLQTLETMADPFWPVDEVVGEIVVMVKRKDEMLPRLRRVVVHVDEVKTPEMMEMLSGACETAGVELIVSREDSEQ